jgi:phospholipid/cholesterol/gamma-HCH transport system substrate-binding protein
LVGALMLLLSPPFAVDSVPKIVRGDYINVSGALDLTLSTVDNAIFTGTGFSGALRALEQSWGRDPSTMIPDIRYTPNPADAPVERGE